MYVGTINEKENMDLKEIKEGSMKGFGGRKERRKWYRCTIISEKQKNEFFKLNLGTYFLSLNWWLDFLTRKKKKDKKEKELCFLPTEGRYNWLI